MSTASIGQMGEFNEAVEDVTTYLERLEMWMLANGISVPTDGGHDKRVATFLSVIGPKAYALIRNLLTPGKPSEYSFDERHQGDSESVTDYVVAIKQLAASCDFGLFLNEALRNRFVCGLRHEAIQKRLLADHDITFATACSVAQAMETASRHAMELTGKSTSPMTDVNRISGRYTKELRRVRATCTHGPSRGIYTPGRVRTIGDTHSSSQSHACAVVKRTTPRHASSRKRKSSAVSGWDI